MGLFSRKNQFVVAGRTVLVTGGSQGMGRGLAKIFAQKGANVILVARNEDKLKAAVEYISAAASHPDTQRFTYISADVTSASENARLLQEATTWNNGSPPDIIWANAGSAYPHLIADTSIDILRSQMDIDYWASAYLARETINLWLASPNTTTPATSKAAALPRHFVITSSVAAFTGLTGYGPYAPAKAALRCLADTLRQELQLYNGARLHKSAPAAYPEMKNHIVFPAGIKSPGFENENKVKHPVTFLLEEADGEPQSEDAVAAAAIKGLERGEFQVTTTFLGFLMRCSAMGGSVRNGWGVVDTLTGWLSYVVWLFIGPDMEKKVFEWGRKNGGAVETVK